MRVYFGRHGQSVVILLCGGIKRSASRRHRQSTEVLGGLEEPTDMTRRLRAAVSHHRREVEELRADRQLACEYLRLAMESLDDPEDRAAGLLALRAIAEASGGMSAIAAEAGLSREALYRSLSADGNPTLKTLLAVLKAVGMRLSVTAERDAAA